jgi:hypothetical protein
MDPYSQYQKQKEFYEYVENQKNNYTDLSQHNNNSIRLLAESIFKIPKKSLSHEYFGLLTELQTVYDIFSMLVELTIHGFYILSEGKIEIFDLSSTENFLVDDLTLYLKHIGFKMIIREEINLVGNDYAIELTKEPPILSDCYSSSCQYLFTPWKIRDYYVKENGGFIKSHLQSPLEQFTVLIKSKYGKNFLFSFRFLNNI